MLGDFMVGMWGALIATWFFLFSASASASAARSEDWEATTPVEWVSQQEMFAVSKILQSISVRDGLPGAIIAAPTRSNPDYYFHWVRDAALTVSALLGVYQTSHSADAKNAIRQRVEEYVNFSSLIQGVRTLSGLGEPKFTVDGWGYSGPWGRPQNDGPALRAISLIQWARILLAEGREEEVRQRLYVSDLSVRSPIKTDLEFVSHHWREPSFDLWEEVKGMHFFTLMVQRRALVEGAALARDLGDPGAAEWYSRNAQLMESELDRFWDANAGYIVATRDQTEGLDYKFGNLDTAVILGLLHGGLGDGFFSWSDWRVQNTIRKLIDTFAQIYPINRAPGVPGVAIGRYPEDRYAGAHFEGGNPWPLCTLALAEALYRSGTDLNTAHLLIERVRYHAHADGSLNEQIDRHSGYMTSVENLTWSYAAILTTAEAVRRYQHH